MNNLFIRYTAIFFSFITIGYASDNLEDKENRSGNTFNYPFKPSKQEEISNGDTTLMNQCVSALQGFTQRIAQAQQDIKPNDLVDLKGEFDHIDYPEEAWQNLCCKHSIIQWPSQNWKQAYGAYIFYPHNEMDKIRSHFTNKHLVFRPDIMFSLIISASYNNPVAQIESSDFLEKQGFANSRFIRRLSEDGYVALSRAISNEQTNSLALSTAFYLLAKHYRCTGEKEKSVVFFQKAGTLCSELELLDIYRNYKGFEDQDTSIERYMDLKQGFKGWGEAYYIVARTFNLDHDKQITLLKEASEPGDYYPAFWVLGGLYKEMGNFEEANKNFLAYGQGGYAYGYLEYAFNLVGESFGGAKSTNFLKEKELGKIIQSAGALQKATDELKDPNAAYWLGIFYQALSKKTKGTLESQGYYENSQRAFIEATRLGDTLSFRELRSPSRGATHPENFIRMFKDIYGDV